MPIKIKLILLQFILIAIPASLILYFALNSGVLPDNDYWGFIAHILSEQGGFSTQINDWIQRENEHYVLLPKIVYALNIAITDGNNIGLSLFAWFMALLQVLLLYFVIPVKSRQHPVLFTVLLFVIALFIFSPRQAHNWILGMSGVAWISANFFCLSAIVSLNRYTRTANQTDLIITLGLSLCAVATYSTSLSLFPTLIIAGFLLKLSRQDQIKIAVFSIAIVSIYVLTYSTPSLHPSIQYSFGDLLLYFLAFIGSLFTVDLGYALLSGSFGLITSSIIILHLYKKQTFCRAILPWVFIQLYVCGNAAMAALARSGYGIEQAFSSRYSSLPALFWLAWIMIASTLCIQLQPQNQKKAFLSLILPGCTIVVFTYIIGFGSGQRLLKRAEKKSLTLVALYSRAYYLDLFHETALIGATHRSLKSDSQRLVTNQHIPFNGIFNHCPKIGSRINRIHPPVFLQYFGRIGELTLRNNQVIEVRGWAYNNGLDPTCIVITNNDNIVKGITHFGLSRPDIPKNLPSISSKNTGWKGYANVKLTDKVIKAYMLSSYDQYWIPIKGAYQIYPQRPYFQRIEMLPDSENQNQSLN